MKKKQLISIFEAMTPSEQQKEEVLQAILNGEHQKDDRKKTAVWRYRRLGKIAAMLMVCTLLGSSLYMIYPKQVSFAMEIYSAVEGAAEHGIAIEEGSQIEVPFGILRKGRKVLLEDNSIFYESSMTGSIFAVSGKGIESITYTSELGELVYIDSIKMAQDPHYIQQMEQSSMDVLPVAVLPMEATSSYTQRGKQVTATYNDNEEQGERSMRVVWNPWYAIDLLSYSDSTGPADVPHETLTVTVVFANGKTAAKTLDLFFKQDGTLVVELSEQ